jgi:hypothetical protein
MSLIAFPRGRTTAAMPDGETLTSIEGKRRWRLLVGGKRTRAYRLQASLSTLAHPFRPCSVRAGGRPARWRWFPKRRVLHAQFRMRSGFLVVRGCLESAR